MGIALAAASASGDVRKEREFIPIMQREITLLRHIQTLTIIWVVIPIFGGTNLCKSASLFIKCRYDRCKHRPIAIPEPIVRMVSSS